MVYAFLIQTLGYKGCDLLYYRFYTCYNSSKKVPDAVKKTAFVSTCEEEKIFGSSESDLVRSSSRLTKLFETSEEGNDFLEVLANKIKMQHSLKMKHCLIPLNEKDNSIRGVFMERKWKEGSAECIPIVWQSMSNIAFALVCKKTENLLQAQNVLDIIISQLEKHVQFLSNPVASLSSIEAVSLVVNQYLPSGELVFMNSKLFKAFEKQLEADLYAR